MGEPSGVCGASIDDACVVAKGEEIGGSKLWEGARGTSGVSKSGDEMADLGVNAKPDGDGVVFEWLGIGKGVAGAIGMEGGKPPGVCEMVQYKDGYQAYALVKKMPQQGFEPNTYLVPGTLKACGMMGSLKDYILLHAIIAETNFESDSAMGSALVDMYIKHESINESMWLFKKLSSTNMEAWGVNCNTWPVCNLDMVSMPFICSDKILYDLASLMPATSLSNYFLRLVIVLERKGRAAWLMACFSVALR
ncbi:hypothetical protein L7F22_044653 [Adiantum nelumboides]|nr:hypothetical protein [Adiantum nelumboides]